MLSACRGGHLNIATLLLERGAGVNDVTKVRNTALPSCTVITAWNSTHVCRRILS